MSGVLHGVIASLKTAVASVTDAYFKYVSLLLNTTSTNGAQNNTFLDSSPNAFSVTRNGDTTQGSFNPYMPTGYWSGYFDGTGDYLGIADSTALDLNSTYTLEFWFYQPAAGSGVFFGRGGGASSWSNTNGMEYLVFILTGTFYYQFNNGSGTTPAQITTAAPASGQWHHVAIGYNGTTTRVWIDGSSIGTSTSAYNLPTTRNITRVGIAPDTSTPLTGYVSNLRVVKGTDVYGVGNTSITVPTAPLTAITNTSLLCLQDNRFIDNSTNAFAITRNGDTRISKFAPFNPPASYSTAAYGGSGYFDGTGDYLTVPDNATWAFSGDFTLEAFVYPTAANFTIVSQWPGLSATNCSFYFGTNASRYVRFVYGIGSSNVQILGTSQQVILNQWNHVAVTRSGTTVRFFVNGNVDASTFTVSGALNDSTADLSVGRAQDASAGPLLTGYLSNLRIVNGTAVYTANFTPPTSPVTAISGTSLLLNFDNAGIYDATAINDAETEGNAQVSTTQAKFGTTSMYFDGTGDRLVVPNRQELRFGTGDFTIEFWGYFDNLTGTKQIFNTSSGSGTTNNSYAIITVGTSLLYYLSSTGTTWNIASGVSMGTVSTGQWFHIALVRNGSTFTPYLNGVAGTTATSSAALFDFVSPLPIGSDLGPTPVYMRGYLQDFRITNGYARYTGNFTPPTAAFPTL